MANTKKGRDKQTRRVMLTLTEAEHSSLVQSAGAFKPATWARYLVILGMQTTSAPELPKAA